MASGVCVLTVLDVDETTVLEYDHDYFKVLDYLNEEQAKCYDIGSAFMEPSSLETIKKECILDYNKALRIIVTQWLERRYDTKRYGPPTWKALVEVVKSPIGGDNAALAEKIAKDHPPHQAAAPLQLQCSPEGKTEEGALNKGPRTIEDQSVSFIIDSKQRDQVYSWEAAGLRIFLPDGPLPGEFDGKIINVRTSTSKGLDFPSNTRIASAIFTIESRVSMDMRLEMEHCCRGNLESLVFAVCTDKQQFASASNRQSFNSTHGIIETRHFSMWVILWRLLSSIACVSSLPIPEEIVVFPYYQVQSTCIKVNLVILKRLSGHIKMAKQHYLATEGWKCDTPSGVCSARFSSSSMKIQVMLSPDWENIGNGWEWKPESPPQIDKSVIEANKEYFRSINLLFRWSTAATGILDHHVTLDGLVIGDDPCYFNLIIDRGTASLSPSISSTLSRPDLVSLSSFRGTDRTINIIEQIGTHYMDFGVNILNDRDGHYVSSLRDQFQRSAEDINRKIFMEWIRGRQGAKPVEWSILATTLHDIGLRHLASDIREKL